MTNKDHARFRRRHVKAIRGNVIYLRPWPRKARIIRSDGPEAA